MSTKEHVHIHIFFLQRYFFSYSDSKSLSEYILITLLENFMLFFFIPHLLQKYHLKISCYYLAMFINQDYYFKKSLPPWSCESLVNKPCLLYLHVSLYVITCIYSLYSYGFRRTYFSSKISSRFDYNVKLVLYIPVWISKLWLLHITSGSRYLSRLHGLSDLKASRWNSWIY